MCAKSLDILYLTFDPFIFGSISTRHEELVFRAGTILESTRLILRWSKRCYHGRIHDYLLQYHCGHPLAAMSIRRHNFSFQCVFFELIDVPLCSAYFYFTVLVHCAVAYLRLHFVFANTRNQVLYVFQMKVSRYLNIYLHR